NMHVIKTADWVVDLGPEGGDKGGEIVVAGPPEKVVQEPRSYTGRFLKHYLVAPATAAAPVAKAATAQG
ncbi:MAG: hypothetical protein EHM91_14440, partial [Planctomycetota bacterium]